MENSVKFTKTANNQYQESENSFGHKSNLLIVIICLLNKNKNYKL